MTAGTSTICSGVCCCHSFRQRLDLLLSGCCGIGVCASRVHAMVASARRSALRISLRLGSSPLIKPFTPGKRVSHQHPDRTS